MPFQNRLKEFKSSFQFRLFSAFSLLLAALSILLGTLYVKVEIREGNDYATSQLHLLTQQLVYSVRLPLYAENRETLQQIAEQVAKAPHLHAVDIISSEGKLLASINIPPRSSTTETIVESMDVFSDPLALSVEEALTGAAPGPASKIGTVRIERETSDLSSNARRLIISSAGIAAIFWLTISGICYLVLRRVTHSFNALMAGIESMQSGNYTSRIDVIANDEPGRAAIAINQLADSLNRQNAENLQLHQDLLKINHSLEAEISERIQAELTVRESEQKLKSLLDIMPVGVAWADQAGNVEYLNQFFVERFGYNKEDIKIARDWFFNAYPDPGYRRQIIDLQRSEIEADKKKHNYTPMFEARVTCKNGEVRHIITKLTMSEKRTVMILIDITDREVLQEQIIKTQKLESIGILAGGIAHNFNNALTGVLGFISLTGKQLDESHKAWTMLQHAERATKRAAGIAKQLLTFARGGAPIKKPVSVRKLVEESVELALNGTKVRSQLLIPDSIHSVIADEDQLSQVFSNLTINAVQAMPKGGTLTISAENIETTSNTAVSGQQIAHVRITFTDEGHGIPAAELSKIFDPYYTTKPSNTGLGLASAHSIINKHGGYILVSSNVGQGTTFTLTLPSTGCTIEQIDNKAESLLTPNRTIGSILVMDDEESIREVARETVKFLGYEVTVCADGHEAVEIYKKAHESDTTFMAAILDLTIPGGMGGAEAAKQILSFDPGAKLIVSSGYSFDPVMSDYKKYGFLAAVAKPYQADDLGSKLSLLQVMQ